MEQGSRVGERYVGPVASEKVVGWARLWVVLTPIAEPTPLPSNSKTSSQTGSSDLAWVSVRRISLPRKSFRYGSLLSTLPS